MFFGWSDVYGSDVVKKLENIISLYEFVILKKKIIDFSMNELVVSIIVKI